MSQVTFTKTGLKSNDCSTLIKAMLANDEALFHEQLRNHPEEVNKKNSEGWTPIMIAAYNADTWPTSHYIDPLMPTDWSTFDKNLSKIDLIIKDIIIKTVLEHKTCTLDLGDEEVSKNVEKECEGVSDVSYYIWEIMCDRYAVANLNMENYITAFKFIRDKNKHKIIIKMPAEVCEEIGYWVGTQPTELSDQNYNYVK